MTLQEAGSHTDSNRVIEENNEGTSFCKTAL